jgi:glycosyltransferase involved in cell wall biosynthesis
MRFGIDAHILGKQRGGVETCVRSLVLALLELDRDNEYVLYVTRNHGLETSALPRNCRLRFLPFANPWFERLLLIPYFYARDKLDLIHVQRALPPWGCARAVVHLHDAIQIANADLLPAWKRFLFGRIFGYSARRAARVVTPTQTSRAEIAAAYGLDPEKITVVPNGIDGAVYYREPDQGVVRATLRDLGIEGPYVLYVGGIERHKNVHLLVEAFAEFRRSHPGFLLVIAGRWRAETRAGYTQELQDRIRSLNLSGPVRLTGHVPIDQLRHLMNGTAMLVFPSIAEGFGFPPLEALACGAPAICADTPVSREVYGDAVLRAKPGDSRDLARTMIALASDPQLAARLLAEGRRVIARHHWRCSAEKLLRVYGEAAGSRTEQPIDSR